MIYVVGFGPSQRIHALHAHAARPTTDRKAIYALQQADAAMVRTARRNEEVDPMFKQRRPRRPLEYGPPEGFVFCPTCLGCVDFRALCPTCDGEGIVRASDAEE
jgi:hypothetical protein